MLATPIAVIFGITYNFLPFMTLPIYVSLEKMDQRLTEAAQDLYAGPWRPGGTIAGAVVGGILFADPRLRLRAERAGGGAGRGRGGRGGGHRLPQ